MRRRMTRIDPAVPQTSLTGKAMRRTDSVLPPDRTVFIVDDDDGFRESLQLLLESAGYVTQAYASGRELFAVVDDRMAGCVLLDTLMAHLNGWDVLQKLGDIRPRLPVVLMSGGKGPATAREAIEAGAIDFLEKPFLEDALLRSIERAFALAEIQKDGYVLRDDVAGALRRFYRMSETERDLFHMMVDGKGDQAIASSKGLSNLELYKYRDRIMEKMEARSLKKLRDMALFCNLTTRNSRPVGGEPNKEITRRPGGVSRHTVEAHRARIRDKTGIQSETEPTRIVIEASRD